MSNGVFLNVGYKSNRGTVHKIRIQETTSAMVVNGVTNQVPAEPSGGYALPRAKVSGGKGQFGLTVRRVGIQFPLSPSGGYAPLSVVYVPWLDGDTFPNPAEGNTATYAGNSCKFVGTSAERFR